MQLRGKLNSDVHKILDDFATICDIVDPQLESLKDPEVRDAAQTLWGNVAAIIGTIRILCEAGKEEETSSLAVGSLLRTLIDGCVSVFQFCKNPPANALLYNKFHVVLTFRMCLSLREHIGCTVLRSEGIGDKITKGLELARGEMRVWGHLFLKSEKNGPEAKEIVEAAVAADKHKKFRDAWYPKHRADILASEGMKWIDEIHYKMLCSATHSDTLASRLLADMDMNAAMAFACQLSGAALYRLVESLRIGIPAPKKCDLHKMYDDLVWRPPAS